MEKCTIMVDLDCSPSSSCHIQKQVGSETNMLSTNQERPSAASSRSEKEKQRRGPLYTPKTHHAQRSITEGNAAQRRQMRVSDALHTDNIIHTGSSTDVHTYRHITHRYRPAPPRLSYYTMWVDMTTREDVTTQSSSVDGCLAQVQGQRGCSTWHQGANR